MGNSATAGKLEYERISSDEIIKVNDAAPTPSLVPDRHPVEKHALLQESATSRRDFEKNADVSDGDGVKISATRRNRMRRSSAPSTLMNPTTVRISPVTTCEFDFTYFDRVSTQASKLREISVDEKEHYRQILLAPAPSKRKVIGPPVILHP
jgi:hypothetical protein